MRRHSLLRSFAAILILASVVAATPATAQSAYLRMQNVVRKFVEQTGYEVIGLGSWISGKAYNATTSDHDLRLLLPPGATPAQQAVAWRDAQQKLVALVEKEFGDKAPDVLGRTNLYAPSQLMAGVEDATDALEEYRKLNQVPNLGFHGTVSPGTPTKYIEGLYGDGATAFTQAYEESAGRLFYNANGKCVMGGTDITHFSEGAPRFTTSGTANTATQWIEHAAEELKAGRGDKVAKYLERIERDLTKARELAGLPVDEAFRGELRSMREALKRSPGTLTEVGEDVTRMLTRGRMEASVLKGFETAGPIGQGVRRVMLDGLTAGNQIGKLLGQAYEAAGTVVSADRLMNALVVYMAVKASSQGAAEDSVLGAIRAGVPQLAWLASVPVAMLTELTNAIMDEAKASGYIMAANSQDAWDLMSGIYSAWGRCDVHPDPRRTFTLDQLVRSWQDESRLSALVWTQCLRASSRDLGPKTGEADMGVAEGIFDKCWPIIRDAWRWQRDMLMAEYLQDASDIIHTPMLLSYSPNPGRLVDGKAQILVKARSRDPKYGEKLDRMTEIIKLLYGKRTGVGLTYYWTPDGAGDRDSERTLTFDKAGTFKVTVRVEIHPYTQFPNPNPRVMLRRELKTFADVTVGTSEVELCRMCGKPVGTTPGCLQCTLYNHDPTGQPVDPGSVPAPYPGE